MYKIEKKNYGFKLTFADAIKLDDIKKWVGESKSVLTNQHEKFGILVDMRTLKPLDNETQAEMVNGQKLYKQKGMDRSAVILASAIMTSQFKRLAHESGIYAWERYIDASSKPDWEKIAENWIVKGIDPDK